MSVSTLLLVSCLIIFVTFMASVLLSRWARKLRSVRIGRKEKKENTTLTLSSSLPKQPDRPEAKVRTYEGLYVVPPYTAPPSQTQRVAQSAAGYYSAPNDDSALLSAVIAAEIVSSSQSSCSTPSSCSSSSCNSCSSSSNSCSSSCNSCSSS